MSRAVRLTPPPISFVADPAQGCGMAYPRKYEPSIADETAPIVQDSATQRKDRRGVPCGPVVTSIGWLDQLQPQLEPRWQNRPLKWLNKCSLQPVE